MFAVGCKDVITEHSMITMIVQDKSRNVTGISLKNNTWLRVNSASEEFSSMLAKHLPVFDKEGVPLGIIKSVSYVENSDVAMVQVIVRGTALLLATEPDVEKQGWKVQVIDAQYALASKPPVIEHATGPLTDKQHAQRRTSSPKSDDWSLEPNNYLKLVSIYSMPALANNG